MGLFSFARPRPAPSAVGASLDEFIGEGEARAAAPLDLSPAAARDWQARLARIAPSSEAPDRALALSAFALLRGGDLFERKASPASRTPPALLDAYAGSQLEIHASGAAAPERDAAVAGILRVLSGNPAIARRMSIARKVALVVVPKGDHFANFGFPPHTNPYAAGIFWNSPREPLARIGLREELILERPHLVVHEMTHAVHFLGLTAPERGQIERFLLPVYRSLRWVEEAVAIYAERAFGARYAPPELEQPDLYGKTRREWDSQHVFARFIAELLRPGDLRVPGRSEFGRPDSVSRGDTARYRLPGARPK